MKKQINGAQLQRQQEEYAFRKALKEQADDYEIRARKWKAEYEMMEYAMRVQELKPKYDAFVEALQKEAEEAFNKLQKDTSVEEVSDAEG